jgi:hypothetical protein
VLICHKQEMIDAFNNMSVDTISGSGSGSGSNSAVSSPTAHKAERTSPP